MKRVEDVDDAAVRVRRAEQILDAAAELLVAYGYRRITIDDVARRAGVGKGTVYLHFASKEALFLTVLMRAQTTLIERMLSEMRADPEAVRLSRLARTAYLAVQEEPIVAAIVTGDAETLGALTRSAAVIAGDLIAMRERTVDHYFQTLREHGVLHSDVPADLQLHAFSAVMAGFLMAEPLVLLSTSGVHAKADMLAHIVRSSFEQPGEPGAAAPRIIENLQRLLDRIRVEIERQKLH
ncbi:helix-turn-helix domain containing protein [Sphaerisporangium sp. TRM90804]|uniref:TetR/AcrR family transcriptional regulator n=1 Tax=Sphaerisporangium sp. TRM90804 TaxID=3031113 RepID=UPI00244925AE|nr:helix-turn-helix domain containing protein [Sphaerisporangium sp. TRM90804]MDH2424429.1 helix-turn-helix domain containing protein [Sphaerisporangium sp. TRM90804]